MRGNERGDRVYSFVTWLCRGAFRLFAIRFDIRGVDRLPASGAAVLVCNHIGFLDFAFVGLLAVRRGRFVRFMAKQGAFRHPVSGPLMRSMRHIPVNRNSGVAAARQAFSLLRAGEIVGVFPEATISRAWTLKPFRIGATAIAVTQRVPIVPVITWGGHRLMTVDGHHRLRRHVPVTIWVGEPIEPTAAWTQARGRTRTELIAQVDQELRRRMAELLDRAQREYPDHPRNAADSWWQPRHLGGSAPDPAAAAALDAERMLD